MNRYFAALIACSAPILANTQLAEQDPYAKLEELYYEVVGEHLGEGRLCTGRSSAVERKQQELAEALADATAAVGERVLLFAVAANSLSDLIRLNEDRASRTGDNGSLLHAAARLADPPILEYLISVGFGIEDRGGASGPALLVAVSENRMDNIAWLIENGADVNATDLGGGTVLHHSLVCQDQALVSYLLEAGAVPNERVLALAERLGISLATERK